MLPNRSVSSTHSSALRLQPSSLRICRPHLDCGLEQPKLVGTNSTMDSTLTSVLAALGGSLVGASTPVLSNFVLQRSLTQRELTNREIAQREELYAEFIRQGTTCYAKALSQSLEKIDEIVAIYALVNRIRLFASESVLQAADEFVTTLISKYSEPNLSIKELETVVLEKHANPLSVFAQKCRAELRQIYERAASGKT